MLPMLAVLRDTGQHLEVLAVKAWNIHGTTETPVFIKANSNSCTTGKTTKAVKNITPKQSAFVLKM